MSKRKQSLDGNWSSQEPVNRSFVRRLSKIFQRKSHISKEVQTRKVTNNKTMGFIPISPTAIGDREYNLNHKSRGKAYIFNHLNFKKYDQRLGTVVDEKNLKKTLPKLGFHPDDIKCFTDLTVSQIIHELEEISKENHEEEDLIMMFVLTHGERDGKIHAYDGDYSAETLWKYLTADNCETLAGKPKIIFIVACRGDKTDSGHKLQVVPRKISSVQMDAAPCNTRITYTIPVFADLLIVYSTMEGYYSFRNPENGTWYIESFCMELKNYEEPYMNFMDFLTAVNNKVGTYSTHFSDPKLNEKKQCPFITSSLTKIINIKINNNIKLKTNPISKPRPKSIN